MVGSVWAFGARPAVRLQLKIVYGQLQISCGTTLYESVYEQTDQPFPGPGANSRTVTANV